LHYIFKLILRIKEGKDDVEAIFFSQNIVSINNSSEMKFFIASLLTAAAATDPDPPYPSETWRVPKVHVSVVERQVDQLSNASEQQ